MKSLKESLNMPYLLKLHDFLKLKLVYCEIEDGSVNNLDLGIGSFVNSFMLWHLMDDAYTYYTGNIDPQYHIDLYKELKKYCTLTKVGPYKVREYEYAATRYTPDVKLMVYKAEITIDDFKKFLGDLKSKFIYKGIRGYSTTDVKEFIQDLKMNDLI